jgi:hypothetical protein
VNRRAVSLWPALRQARIDDDQADSIMTSVIDAFEPDDVIAQATSYRLFCPHILLRTQHFKSSSYKLRSTCTHVLYGHMENAQRNSNIARGDGATVKFIVMKMWRRGSNRQR